MRLWHRGFRDRRKEGCAAMQNSADRDRIAHGPPGAQQVKRAWRLLAALLIVALSTVVVQGDFAVRTPQPHPSDPPTKPQSEAILGTYASAVYRQDNFNLYPQIDAGATVSQLRALNMNAYAYLISPVALTDPEVTRRQLTDLARFAQAAFQGSIDTYVYLLPPSEVASAVYQPYGWDYVAWAAKISSIARSHPSIRGVIIDDFGANLRGSSSKSFYFTPDYVSKMRIAAHTAAPWMQFIPVLYYHDLLSPSPVLSQFSRLFDAVIFAYTGEDPVRQSASSNTTDSSKVISQGTRAADVLSCRPTPECTRMVFPRQSSGKNIDSVSFEFPVRVLADRRRTLSLWLSDNRRPADEPGYEVRVLVDKQVVARIHPTRGEWTPHTIDFTAVSSGRSSVDIEIEVVRRGIQNEAIDVRLGEIGWTGISSGIPEPAVDQAVPPVQVLDDRSVPMIFMTYAAPLGKERGRGASVEYVRQVLDSVDVLRQNKRIIGSMMYLLNIAGDSGSPGDARSADEVARRYERWSKS